MYNPIPDIKSAMTSISKLYIQQGMPSKMSTETYDFTSYDAIGWYDLADNSSRTFAVSSGTWQERESNIEINFQFYTQDGAKAASFAGSISSAMIGLGYRRAACNTFGEPITDSQTLARTIMRFVKKQGISS